MVSFLLAGLVLLVGLQRLWELRLARRNRARSLEAGAREVGAGHYPFFFLLHGGWLGGWIGEAWSGGPVLSEGWPLWLALFLAAQGLRYWSIRTLGRFWNTRVLVIPGAPRVQRGPYRFLDHPNYLAVSLELLSLPFLFEAWRTALLASLGNGVLLLGFRLPAEEKALSSLGL
ncbi:MAG: hypothetical protein HY697_01800 [Deltaproteobacteria bacterium]|nr:hypothetical protein [Deltaproteobacteria bacterium]